MQKSPMFKLYYSYLLLPSKFYQLENLLKDEAWHLTNALKILEPFVLNIYTVDANEIAEQGGVLNCVTWGG